MSPAGTSRRGKSYRYYRCSNRDKKGREACPATNLPAPAIEDFVVERIREAVGTPGMAARVESELVARVATLRESLQKNYRNLLDRLRDREGRFRQISDDLRSATGKSRRVLQDHLEHVGQDLSETEEALRAAKRKLVALEQAEVDGPWVASMLRDFTDVWDVLSVENRQRLVKAIVRRVIIDDRAGTGEVELVDLAADLPDDNYPAPRRPTHEDNYSTHDHGVQSALPPPP